ncbi:MAG: histidine triad nucleotide-binding protein [Alphaproteobacteria bacterium]|jgi:diadenosine tetraphosphate (Ap4A) HIT family hydrolase|nr:histidine triad nucleotide-binding protein [Alphaproteobacteria bacterium]
MAYDDDNVFQKILRGELPCNKVYEDEHVLAFHDINPLMPVHVLVIPKGRYVSLDDFSAEAPAEAQAAFVRALGHVARLMGVDESGYRIVANNGVDGRQEVPHLHAHIFGGRRIRGRMVRPEE